MKRSVTCLAAGVIVLCQTHAQNLPAISAVCPSTLQGPFNGAQSFNLTIQGSGFQPGDIILWNSEATLPVRITPVAVTSTEMRAVVASNLVPSTTNTGAVLTIPVRVSSPTGASNSASIAVGFPTTQFCSLDPKETTAGVPAFPVRIYGAGLSFTSGQLGVNWTIGSASGSVPNVQVDPSGTALDVTLPKEALLTPGTLTLTASTPGIIVKSIPIRQATGDGSVTAIVNPAPTLTVPTFEHGYVSLDYAAKIVRAQGGTHPLRWSATAGGLPPGFTLIPSPLDDSVATISGTPSQAITSLETFNFNIAATDSAPATPVTVMQPATVTLEPLPALQYRNVPPDHRAVPADQLSILLGVQQPSSVNISGNVTLSFNPEQGVPLPSNSNPQVGFLDGRSISTTHSYSIPPNCALPSCGQALTMQAGNVAGVITLHIANLATSDPNLPAGPLTPADQTITMPKLIPSVDPGQISIRNVSGGFEVCIPGFSTPRDMATAAFRFVPADKASLQAPPEPHDVTGTFASWYQNPASTLGGSNFTYVQPFTVQGDIAAVGSLFVTLSNSVGSTAEFGPIDLRNAPRCNAAF